MKAQWTIEKYAKWQKASLVIIRDVEQPLLCVTRAVIGAPCVLLNVAQTVASPWQFAAWFRSDWRQTLRRGWWRRGFGGQIQ